MFYFYDSGLVCGQMDRWVQCKVVSGGGGMCDKRKVTEDSEDGSKTHRQEHVKKV